MELNHRYYIEAISEMESELVRLEKYESNRQLCNYLRFRVKQMRIEYDKLVGYTNPSSQPC